MRAAKPLAALALTAAGSALVVGFQVPDAGAVTVGDTATDATSATTTTPVQSSGTTSGSPGPSSSDSAASGVGTSDSTGSSSTGSGSTGSGSTGSSGYADGTYLGAAVSEPWGTFQVQATVSGGQLVDVTIVSAPTDGHSSRINSSAVPVLTSEALAVQSADVDVISGATWTSESYAASLQAALDDAAVAVADAAA